MVTASPLKGRIDRSLIEGGFWERATFTVPKDTPHERVMFHFPEYLRKAGEHFVAMGCTVLNYTPPVVSLSPLPTDGDRRRYDFWLWLRRRPETIKLSIDERLIPEMQEKGLKLI